MQRVFTGLSTVPDNLPPAFCQQAVTNIPIRCALTLQTDEAMELWNQLEKHLHPGNRYQITVVEIRDAKRDG